jgi:hypothetical protein
MEPCEYCQGQRVVIVRWGDSAAVAANSQSDQVASTVVLTEALRESLEICPVCSGSGFQA